MPAELCPDTASHEPVRLDRSYSATDARRSLSKPTTLSSAARAVSSFVSAERMERSTSVEHLQALREEPLRLFGPSPLRDVAHDGREQLATLDDRLRDRCLDGELVPIGMERQDGGPALDHEARGRANVSKVEDVLRVLRAESFRNEALQRLAPSLGGRAAEHLLGGGVEHDDALVLTYRDHRVHRGLHDGGDLRLALTQARGSLFQLRGALADGGLEARGERPHLVPYQEHACARHRGDEHEGQRELPAQWGEGLVEVDLEAGGELMTRHDSIGTDDATTAMVDRAAGTPPGGSRLSSEHR